MKKVQPNEDDVKRGFSSDGNPYFPDDPKAPNPLIVCPPCPVVPFNVAVCL